jgi:hypothetical protein
MFRFRLLGVAFLVLGCVLFGTLVSIFGLGEAFGQVCAGALTAGTFLGGGYLILANY